MTGQGDYCEARELRDAACRRLSYSRDVYPVKFILLFGSSLCLRHPKFGFGILGLFAVCVASVDRTPVAHNTVPL